MDPKRLNQAYRRLQSLDERMGYKVRPRSGSMVSSVSSEQLEERMKDLARYTLELKEVVHELFLGLAGKTPPENDPEA